MSEPVWKLPELLEAAGIRVEGPVPPVPIRQVTDDSRAARPGTLFVAVKGSRFDGHRFVAQAAASGAAAVLTEEEIQLPPGVAKLRVAQTRPLLGPLAHAFFGFPSRRLRLVGITGTNGKTTVAWLVQYLLESAGIGCGLLGTICYRAGGPERPSDNTTPGPVVLQSMLSQMLDSNLQACVMEVSSHALEQERVQGLEWACGVFTNFSSEHLDYHRTLEEYLQAKLRLFRNLGKGTAVLNRDDPVWEQAARVSPGRVLTFGLHGPADLGAGEIRVWLEGTSCQLKTPEGIFPIRWNLIGRHNLENLLAALGAVVSLGVPLRRCLEAVPSFAGVPGRLERIDEGQPFPVFVDYAHTDGALRPVLEQLRAASDRRILLVFGCGGDRDRTKRPRMGQVASELADRVIITSDNPRSEDPESIAQEAAAGVRGTIPCGIVLDRREAIRVALESADEKWLVLIAGKGHETGQIVKDRILPFDDRAVAREILRGNSTSVRPELVEGRTGHGLRQRSGERSTGSP